MGILFLFFLLPTDFLAVPAPKSGAKRSGKTESEVKC